jgi:hypothetical protein
MRKGAHIDVSLATENSLILRHGYPYQLEQRSNFPELDVFVVFTSISATMQALKRAAVLAESLASRITLLVPQVVPYPLPLAKPGVNSEFTERRFYALASANRVQTSVRIYLCRDRWDALAQVLKPNSLVVLGEEKHWWPTASGRMARKLRRMGHAVVVVETE